MILPQLAKQAEVTSLEHFIKDDSWVAEQKLDGNRILLVSPGMDMPATAITRNGSLYSKKIPQAIKDFRFPTGERQPEMAGAWVLDGELVGDTYWIFDLPKAPLITPGGNPMVLWQRRAALERLLSTIQHPFKLAPQARTPEEKIKLAETALKNNYEGLVLKKADSPYRSGGRTDEWLKVKFTKTADCVVAGVRVDGKDSVDLSPFDPLASEFVSVGRSSLIGKEKTGAIAVGDVLEVRYLYAGAGGRLYQPTILRKRDDKHMAECTVDQMQFVNKEVLEAL